MKKIVKKTHKVFNQETISAIKRSKNSKNLITHKNPDSMFKEWGKFARSNNPNQTTINSFNQIKQGKCITSSLADFKKSLKADNYLEDIYLSEKAEKVLKEIEEGKAELISWEEVKEKYGLEDK